MKIKFLPAHPDLAPFLYEHRQDPINKHYNPLTPSTIESLKERLSKSSSDLSDLESAESFFWFLELDSKIIGIASIQNVNKMMMTAEIGYGVSTEERSRGIATEAVRQLTQMAFSLTSLRKLIAFVHEDNMPSRKVLAKSGYSEEGLLREHFIINGKPVNEVIYGILRSEVL